VLICPFLQIISIGTGFLPLKPAKRLDMKMWGFFGFSKLVGLFKMKGLFQLRQTLQVVKQDN